MGSLFAAMAAWYRRFLALSSQRGAAARSSGEQAVQPDAVEVHLEAHGEPLAR